MIIETRGDVVHLSGSLNKNLWLTIRAAAGMLLNQYPGGIIVDCSELISISEDGAKTFLTAIEDIEANNTRIIVVNLPPNVLKVVKSIPGVRSQLPLAATIDEARASLRRGHSTSAKVPPPGSSSTDSQVIVPLFADVDLVYGADIACRVSRARHSNISLVFFMEVTRTLPLNAPLPHQEEIAEKTLQNAREYLQINDCSAIERVERVRDAVDGLLNLIKQDNFDLVVVGASSHSLQNTGHDRFDQLVDSLLHRAACEVLISRLKMQDTV